MTGVRANIGTGGIVGREEEQEAARAKNYIRIE